MILAINAGNALVSMGLYHENRLCAKAVFSNYHETTSDENAYRLRSFVQSAGYELGSVKGAIISPVNLISSAAIAEAVCATFGIKALQIGPGIRTGLDILLKDSTTLGADIVATSVAAIHKYPSPIIVIIVGATALTFSAINERGQFMGGAIAPSPKLALSALCESAAYLPTMPIEAPARIIGADTREAINSGVVYGAAATIRGMAELMVDKITANPHNKGMGSSQGNAAGAKIIITGSVAPAILPYIGIEVEHDENLLLDGLNILYHRNRKG